MKAKGEAYQVCYDSFWCHFSNQKVTRKENCVSWPWWNLALHSWHVIQNNQYSQMFHFFRFKNCLFQWKWILRLRNNYNMLWNYVWPIQPYTIHRNSCDGQKSVARNDGPIQTCNRHAQIVQWGPLRAGILAVNFPIHGQWQINKDDISKKKKLWCWKNILLNRFHKLKNKTDKS